MYLNETHCFLQFSLILFKKRFADFIIELYLKDFTNFLSFIGKLFSKQLKEMFSLRDFMQNYDKVFLNKYIV